MLCIQCQHSLLIEQNILNTLGAGIKESFGFWTEIWVPDVQEIFIKACLNNTYAVFVSLIKQGTKWNKDIKAKATEEEQLLHLHDSAFWIQIHSHHLNQAPSNKYMETRLPRIVILQY